MTTRTVGTHFSCYFQLYCSSVMAEYIIDLKKLHSSKRKSESKRVVRQDWECLVSPFDERTREETKSQILLRRLS